MLLTHCSRKIELYAAPNQIQIRLFMGVTMYTVAEANEE